MKIALSELVQLVGGKLLQGDVNQDIQGFASLKEARAGDLTFFSDDRYRAQLARCRAAAVLVGTESDGAEVPEGQASVLVEDPSRAFDQVIEAFGVEEVPFEAGIHPTAVVAEDAEVDPATVSVGPHAVIESGARIGAGSAIGAGSFVGRKASLGEGCRLHANVSVQHACELGDRVILHSGVVIGGDGFGYEFEQGRHRKIRQSGIVQIDNDVEIGAGTTVDRARFGRTWIGEGTKIDNLVQIGHNVVIGKHCILVACVAIAGSAVLEDYVVVAAQAGIAGHVTVGSMATLGGRSGVTKDIPPGQKSYLGFPATDAMTERRRVASVARLPKLAQRVRALEKRLEENS